MRWLVAILMGIALSGQAPPETGTPDVPEAPERIRVLAIHATSEGRDRPSVDPTLTSVSAFLEELPYDTFREASFHDFTVAYGEEGRAELNDTYAFLCKPLRLSEADEVVLEAWITMGLGDKRVEALRVTGRATRGHGLVFRGLTMPQGELVVIMSVAEATSEQGGSGGGASGSSSQQSQQQSQGSGKGGDSEGASGGNSPEQDDEELDPSALFSLEEREEEAEDSPDEPSMAVEQREADGDQPTELVNVEAILRELEEVDRREQAAMRKRREETRIRGDWW